MLEVGQAEERIIKQCVREGVPLPSRIADAPALLPGLEVYLLAFLELSSTRAMGMGRGPIPWWAIENWARAEDLDEEARDLLHYLVGVLDVAYMEHSAAKGKT